ncbi:Response regulator receiver [metagenome]|uniref:Response regulator receiver n=1 Tax=metagenome TaxID=256318 RepID=A0A2P2CC40_9ZZZZ
MEPQVLLVEDDEDIAMLLTRTLQREGYAVSLAGDGEQALELIATTAPHVVILDVGLPGIDGFEVCRRARAGGFEGGIIIVTARGGELDRVVGLDYGADDYLAKPFGVAELHARVRALLRRAGPRPSVASAGVVRVDPAARRAFLGEVEVGLTAKEFDVLALLAAEPGTVVTRGEFIARVWDEHYYGSTKTLDVTIGRLRAKLAAAGATDRIAAVRGVGFRLERLG